MSFLLRLCCGLVVASSLAHVANAWVQGYQAFPNGEAPVIIDPFCKTENCNLFSKEKWRSIVLSAITEWNNAKTGFTFLPLAESPSNDPCHTHDVVSIILTDGENVCPGNNPFSANGVAVLRKHKSRIYINIEEMSYLYGNYPTILEERLIALLLHELGHVIGLGHPDEAGQEKKAIMNSNLGNLRKLQPDDIEGAMALYGGPGPDALVGFLENPRHNSSQSGVGMVTGWVCEAETVEVEINDSPHPQIAAYGTERLDTEKDCGDTDNGFGLLLNWNRLGEGEHTITVFVDGQELGRSTITVTTLGEEFPKGLDGEYTLDGFPDSESSVVIRWEESLQNFVIIERNP